MHIGLIGLGKMGFNMRERLRNGGIEVTGFDRNPDVTDVATVDELIAAVPAPRLIWVMVPSGEITDAVITELGNKLDAGDLVIDGGNSRFTEDQKHGAALAEKGIRFADCGVSGGVWGLQNGYGLMAGGDAARHRTAHSPSSTPSVPQGERADSFVHVGGVGAGHYAKMVHNGIEYGLMQAYAEGYELLAAKDIVDDLPGTFRAWQKGTVVRSWLLDLMVKALDEDPGLESDLRLRRGFRRRPLDSRGSHRQRRARPGDHGGALCQVLLPRGQFAGHEDGVRAAPPVRRPRDPAGQVIPAPIRSPETRVYLEKLSLTDFRSYAQVDLSLEPGVTVLVGSNGIGKTNLMEAIGYLATLSSHRVSTDAPLLRFGTERAMIRAKLVRGEQATVLELEINAARANRGTDQPEQSGPCPGPAGHLPDGALRPGRPGAGQGRSVQPPPVPG